MIPQHPAGWQVFDLGRTLSPMIPHHPYHPPFLYSVTKLHGDAVDQFGNSASSDIITMGTHTGTHIDGLAHFATDMRLHDGVDALAIVDKAAGYSMFGIDEVPPILAPAVLADVPAFLGVEALPDDHTVDRDELEAVLESQGTPITPESALLVRTGWGREWPHVRHPHESPGPTVDAVLWAWDRGARLFGSDTIPFERLPVDGSPVHRALLIERGAHIIEIMDLEEPSAARAYEFLLVLSPLKIRGATGAPVRPVGIVLNGGGS